MKKLLFWILIVIIFVLLVILGFLLSGNISKLVFGANQPTNLTNNPMDYLMGYSTSTKSYCVACPVKVLDKANSRQFAYFTTDSVTPVYLFFPAGKLGLNLTNTYTISDLVVPETFTNYQYATGTYDGKATATITDLTKGLKLTATSSPFIVDLSKQINSEVWATSTPEGGVFGAQIIRVMYVQ